MNPIILWCNFWMGMLRAASPRKGSTFGWPEPYETFFDDLNDTIKRKQDDIARLIGEK